MILEIKKYPDSVLKDESREVEEINEETRILIKDMIETMYASQGVGLAAPQVGVPKRILVLDVGAGPKVFINPKIVSRKGKEISEEGCLSVPGEFLKVKRAREIIVEALNEKGGKFKVEATGLLARCLQQEIDHLNGILILDKVNLWKKFKRKLSKR
jgi:peptide deformylase